MFAMDQRADGFRGFADAFEVLGGAAIDADDVVPGAHRVTIVDGHRPHGRVREHEAQWRDALVEQFRYQRLEIVAIGAQAVHPDNGVRRGRSGFHRDCFQHFQFRLLQTMVSEMVVAVRFAAHSSWSMSTCTPGMNV